MLRSKWTSRLAVAHLIAATLFASLGVSIVPVIDRAGAVASAGDADFFCAGHGCGCLTAEMCRTACCCVKPAPVAAACHDAAPTCHMTVTPQADAAPGDEADAADDAPVRGWTIRSASCAGRDHWMVRHLLIHWVPATPRPMTASQPLVGLVAIADPIEFSVDSPALDPPPPRVV